MSYRGNDSQSQQLLHSSCADPSGRSVGPSRALPAPSASPTPNARSWDAILANAIYFKGLWSTPFEKT